MKYRIKTEFDRTIVGDNYITDGDIIELEPIEDEPKQMAIVGCGCILCSEHAKDEIKQETLEERFRQQRIKWISNIDMEQNYPDEGDCDIAFAQIAEDHFKENPDEIDCVPAVAANTMSNTISNLKRTLDQVKMSILTNHGLVSLDKVLECFDKAEQSLPINITHGILRKALEDLK